MATATPYRKFFHPTDFSESCLPAFDHALAVTVAARGALTIFHACDPEETKHLERWPPVEATLAKWGRVAPGANEEAVFALGLTIDKVETRSTDAVAEIHRQSVRSQSDLLFLATHARTGLSRIRHKEVATSSMRAVGLPSLFLPSTAKSLVDPGTGKLKLERVLIAVDHDPGPEPALRAVGRLLATIGAPAGICREVHVGKTFPLTGRPQTPGWTWERMLLPPGNVDAKVTQQAVEWDADLIAMVSRGRDQLADLLLGTMLDQILNGSPCPVLAVPA
jgi:nucleotide-binding universal stress UspA family protein